MSTISVYLNRRASQSSHQFKIDELKKYFFRYEIKINEPKNFDELISSVISDRDNNVEYIFSIGGDGTAHSIAQHLVGSKTKLLVLPGGTANDFAEEVGTKEGIKRISYIFHAKSTRKVDVLNVNDRYLITNGGIGIAQEVATKVTKARNGSNLFKAFTKLAGKNTYTSVFAQHILMSKFKLYSVSLESKDSPLSNNNIKSPLILVNNQSKLAGKYPIAPNTKNNDGKFNVSIFLHDNKMDFIKCVSSIIRGVIPEKDRKLVQFETDSLKLKSLNGEKLLFFGDGEDWIPSTELNIEVLKNSLEVFSKEDDISLSGYSLDEVPEIV